MRVWLDDEREMPDSYDVHVRTAGEAIKLLRTGKVTGISLDHDLGPGEAGTGYEVALWIEEQAYKGNLRSISVAVHTKNVVGRKKMCVALQNATRYWMDQDNYM